MEAAAVICAAGASARMGGIKKEYQRLNSGLTVLGSAVMAFSFVPAIETIVIAVREGSKDSARDSLAPESLAAQKPQILFVNGGESRRASVFNALNFLLKYNPSYVLIHDGARPWVTASLINKTLESVKKYGAVIPLLPLTETPKEYGEKISVVDASGIDTSGADIGVEPYKTRDVFITKHLKRANTGIAQTPQAFKFHEILYAHQKAAEAAAAGDEDFTDDAEIWGRFCGQVAVIAGDPENKKITFQGDI